MFRFIYVALAWGGPRLGHAVEAPVTRLRQSPAVEAVVACDVKLSTTVGILERTLRGRARWGSAYLGLFTDLEDVMRQAGRPSVATWKEIEGLQRAFNLDPRDAFLTFTVEQFRRMVRGHQLLMCVLSAECSLSTSTTARIKMHASIDPQRAVMLIPLRRQSPNEFATEFIGAFTAVAADQMLQLWLDALSPRREPGVFDRFAHREGFKDLFRALAQMHARMLLEDVLPPQNKPLSSLEMAGQAYRSLVSGPPEGRLGQLVTEIGLTDRNLSVVTQQLVEDMLATIERVR